jgi:glycerol kinase
MKKTYIGAIDQGTTSTRFLLFDKTGQITASHQVEHRQIFPEPGWVEHDPMSIWENTKKVISGTLQKAKIQPEEIDSIGITNQRETTVVWNPKTGKPYYNAIVWQDTRTKDICEELISEGGIDRFRQTTGLPVSTYFSATKLSWLLQNVEGLREAANRGEVYFGNIDTWLLWWLTGGPNKGRHVTDVTNASRTLLLDLETLSWDAEMLKVFDIPPNVLPEIRPSAEPKTYGSTTADGPFDAVIPLTGILGDQQAALFGQACYEPGEAKNTYGTGCFMLTNTGENPIPSQYGLITTVAYRVGDNPAAYALEGSVAIAGALVQWFRDNLGLIKDSPEIEAVAGQVQDNGGIYYVPAFSGLFAPYWKSSARGTITGITHATNKSHLARAVLESTAFQAWDIFEAMQKDTGQRIPSLKVDGGMVANDLLMQFQADILDIPVIVSSIAETTSLGACYAAGLATGFWKNPKELRENWASKKQYESQMSAEKRRELCSFWKKAVERSMDWL